MLTATLIAAALLAGLAGAWSPCGFSMVETIAPSAAGGRVRGTVAAALAFALGALAGGVVTFGGLALAGQELGLGNGLALGIAAAVLLAAAAGDSAGRRIVPQVRRQVPESWRRLLPLPLASGLYGVLLGLGFTTFVLSFTTYALAAACLALGEPATGVAVGAAFAAGRAIPVLLLAPYVERPAGAAIATAMAERPDVLRRLRAAAALALLAGCAVLLGEPGALLAAAAPVRTFRFAGNATDPDAAETTAVWHVPGEAGRILRDGRTDALPGDSPAIGGGLVAWRAGGRIEVADVDTLRVLASVPAPAADEIAVSDRWLAWRESDPAVGPDRIMLTDPGGEAAPHPVFTSPRDDGQIGRPALDAGVLAFHLVTPRSSRLVEIDLGAGLRRELVAPPGTQLLQPSLQADSIAFVRATARRQHLIIRSRSGATEQAYWSTEPTARRDAGFESGRHRHRAGYPRGRPPRLWRRPPPGYVATLWTTALGRSTAYVTRLVHHRGSPTTSEIIAVELDPPAEHRPAEEDWVTT